MDKLIYIYIYKATGNSLDFLKINLLNYIIYLKRVTCKELLVLFIIILFYKLILFQGQHYFQL